MKIHWPFLIAALVVLAPPLPIPAKLLRALSSSRRKGSPARVPEAIGLWQNWVDLLRAALGAYLLMDWAIEVAPEQPGAEFNRVMLTGAILGAALLFQTVRLSRGVQFLAPVFFLCGVTLLLGGALQGAFAVAVGWLFAIGGKNLAYQLPAMSVALAVAGYVLGLDLPLMLNCVLIFVPSVLALLFKKRLLFAVTVPAT